MYVLYSNSWIFVIPVYIFNGRKQTFVDTIGILSALGMRGLHDKRHLLAKLLFAVVRIAMLILLGSRASLAQETAVLAQFHKNRCEHWG